MTKKIPKEQRIDGIITAAVAEFLEKGYENTTMEAIAIRSGLTKGGLYHHFSGKDELLGYANQYLGKPIDDIVTEAKEKTSARDGLLFFVNGYIRFWYAHPRKLAFFFLTMSKAFEIVDIQKMYSDYYRTMHADLAELFSSGIARGHFIEHDPLLRAVSMMAALDGITSGLVLDPDLKVEPIIGEIQDIFILSLNIKRPNDIEK